MSETNEQQGGSGDCDMHLHAEIEVLKQALVDKQSQLIAMETACLRESDRQVELEDSIIAWQDKYDRLYESHKRVQKVNQTLEDKLLKLVDRNSGERAQLTSDVATLSVRLAQANYNIAKLQHEIERYKTDINLAIQLLQCKPDSFVPQKVSSLPVEIQSKVSSYMRLETNSHSDSEGSTSGVGLATPGSYKVLPVSDSPPPLCPFPPTAMVYSMRGLDARNNSDCNGKSDQMISPSAMAKYLQDELKASEIKHCDTCNCSPKDLTVLIDEPKTYNVGTQTIVQSESGNSLCLRCNSNLNSPSRTNSPYIMKIVKSSDSVISETKSSVSDLLDNEKLFTPAKKDDLMVNPILGHHRLCDRTVSKQQQQQLCDTAKYIVETQKLENEIADLRKFNDKSPKLTLGGELCSTFNRNLMAAKEVKLVESNEDVRQNGSATLIANTGHDKETIENTEKLIAENSNLHHQQQVQGTCTSVKSDTSDITRDKKPENNMQVENISRQGSTDKNMNKAGNTITGSTNSLWSKSSSSEGAKIFENFNRNLIKTIKAENPSHRGPRLCALRIQNGSNNILLDNIDSEITPIVYTRPARFLDEELDDSKDIITSKISMLMSKRNSQSTASSQVNLVVVGENAPSCGQQHLDSSLGSTSNDVDKKVDRPIATNNGDIDLTLMSNDTSSYSDVINSVFKAENLDVDAENPQNKQLSSLQLLQPQTSSIALSGTLGNDAMNFIANIELGNGREHLLSAFAASPSRQNSDYPNQNQSWNGLISDYQQNSKTKQHYDVMVVGGDNSLNSSIKNTTSKSGTHSSSMSSSGVDIDVQESALLRRQQLTRVAEWVQNNSQQQHQDLTSASSTHNCSSTHLIGSNHNCTTLSKASLSRNSNNSVEKFSISDSTSCRVAPPILLNGFQSTLNNNHQFHSNLSQPQLQLTNNKDSKSLINNCQNTHELIAQDSYHTSFCQDAGFQFKNLRADASDKPILIQPRSSESMRGLQSHSHEHQSVDLAQMEYNVKQFLLKQNEWSIFNVNKSLNSSSNKNTATSPDKATPATPRKTGNSNSNSSCEKTTIAKNHPLPLRTETNL